MVPADAGVGVSGTPQVEAGEVELVPDHVAPSPVPYRRSRGIRLNELDRSRRWVIGFSGRRWEVVGVLAPDATDVPARAQVVAGEASGGRPKAGTEVDRRPLAAGRHSAAPPGGPGHHAARLRERDHSGASFP